MRLHPRARSSQLPAKPPLVSSATQLWLLHVLAVCFPVLMFLAGLPSWWVLGIGGAAVMVTYLVIGYRESKSQSFWLSPLSFFFFWYSVGYGLSAIYAASEVYQVGYMNLLAKVVDGADLAAGYVLSLCGAVALHGGYVWMRALRQRNPTSATMDSGRSDFRLWVLIMLLGIITLVRPEYFDSIGAARAILQLAPFGIMLTYCSLPREHFGLNRDLYLFYLFAGNAMLIGAAFYDGSKYYSMLAFLPLLSAMLVRKTQRKLLPFAIAGGIALYMFVVAPVIMRARTIQGVDSRLLKIEIAAEESASSFREDTLFAFQEQIQKFLYRQFESTATGFIVSDVREHGFRYGETMTNLTYAFIPRLFWPDKPSVTRGNWFTAYLGGSGSEEESTTSTGIYSAGELYWNFGVPGVLIGMFVMGCLFSLLMSGLGPGPLQFVVPIIIFMNVVARVVEEATATEVFVLLIYLCILLIAYRYVQIVYSRSKASVRTGRSPAMIHSGPRGGRRSG